MTEDVPMRLLPITGHRLEYFLCAPPPMTERVGLGPSAPGIGGARTGVFDRA